jgi:hypothetical protein
MTEYDRPNTVSGLVAKLKELCDLRERYRDEIKRLSVDIEHLDACIRLFDPKANRSELKELVAKPRLPKGSVKRFLLSTLREAEATMTSRQIADHWIKDHGIEADDAMAMAIRKRLSVCIANCLRDGLIESVGKTTDNGASEPYKLWQLKRGD